jgi:proline dehydrogenase
MIEQGCSVGILDLTQGEMGTRGTPEIRAAEAEAARKVIGLDIADDLVWDNVEAIVRQAAQHDNFVRIDMEGSAYTERTLSIFRRIHDLYPSAVGIVLQSYLYRTDRDLEEIIERRARVRIVRGAYNEPDWVAWPRKSDVDERFKAHIMRLLVAGCYPAIATHDERMIRGAQRYARRKEIDPARFEFQMIYGVRRDLQEAISREGYNMRIYVPFGRSWFPYFMRRLAERPANLLFVLRQLRRG